MNALSVEGGESNLDLRFSRFARTGFLEKAPTEVMLLVRLCLQASQPAL